MPALMDGMLMNKQQRRGRKQHATKRIKTEYGGSYEAIVVAGRSHRFLNAAKPTKPDGTLVAPIHTAVCELDQLAYSHLMTKHAAGFRTCCCDECRDDDTAIAALKLQEYMGINLGWRRVRNHEEALLKSGSTYEDHRYFGLRNADYARRVPEGSKPKLTLAKVQSVTNRPTSPNCLRYTIWAEGQDDHCGLAWVMASGVMAVMIAWEILPHFQQVSVLLELHREVLKRFRRVEVHTKSMPGTAEVLDELGYQWDDPVGVWWADAQTMRYDVVEAAA